MYIKDVTLKRERAVPFQFSINPESEGGYFLTLASVNPSFSTCDEGTPYFRPVLTASEILKLGLLYLTDAPFYKLSCFNTVSSSCIINWFCCVEGPCAYYSGLSACSCTITTECNMVKLAHIHLPYCHYLYHWLYYKLQSMVVTMNHNRQPVPNIILKHIAISVSYRTKGHRSVYTK
jgi:hypothetical protein